jgi:hypothetical protein
MFSWLVTLLGSSLSINERTLVVFETEVAALLTANYWRESEFG